MLRDHDDWNVPDEVKAIIVLAPDPKRKSGWPKKKEYHQKKRKFKLQNVEDEGRMVTIGDHITIQQLWWKNHKRK